MGILPTAMSDDRTDVVIIGAGASGLAAARALSASDLRIIVVEARDRLGGRIHTLREPGWPLPVELGAEFVHGTPAETWDILRAARLAACDVADTHWFLRNGRLKHIERFWEETDSVFGRLAQMKEPDLSFADFAARYAADAPADARDLAFAFVEGFDGADTTRISARSIADEQAASEQIAEDRNFRVLDGYDRIIEWLAAGLDPQKVHVRLNTVATEVKWSRGSARVAVANGKSTAAMHARQVLVTIPVGVWKASATEVGAVKFDPELTEKRRAAAQMEMGPIVKVSLRFRDAFWEQPGLPNVEPGQSLWNAAFLHARGPSFFTWWTWLPVRAPVLVGWSGGPAAAALSHRPQREILDEAVESLATFLGLRSTDIAEEIEAARACDWQADPFSRGAYSFTLVGGAGAGAVLAEPIDDTLFFAGEATHGGQSGTVAGALASGYNAARQILW